MSLFRRNHSNNKEMIVLKTMQQRDTFIDRLEKAHVEYDVSETRDNVYSQDVTYIIRVNAEDLKKVS